MVDPLLRNLRKTFRGPAKNLGFSFTVVLVLAAGIAATTVIFSVVQTVLVRPLDFPRGKELVHVYTEGGPERLSKYYLYPRDAAFLRRFARTLSGVAFFTERYAIATRAGEPFGANGLMVSANYFEVLGAKPEVGRFFTSADELTGAEGAVIISDPTWRSHLAADPGVIGRKISLDGNIHTIVGVAGPQFSSLSDVRWPNVSFWVPLVLSQQEQQKDSVGLIGIGRLRSGMSADAANGELRAISMQHAEALPDRKDEYFAAYSIAQERLRDTPEKLRVVAFSVLLLLLTACVNVSGVLLARVTARRGEFALRAALGASATQLFQPVFSEALLLALVACAMGLGLASAMLKIVSSLGASIVPGIDRAHLDIWTLLFAMFLAFLTAVGSSVAPGWFARRRWTAADLQSVRRGSSSRMGHKLGAGFVAAQFALTLVLLTESGLLFNNFLRLATAPLGFDPHNVLVTAVQFPEEYGRPYPVDDILARMRAIPGVQNASVIDGYGTVMEGGVVCRPRRPGSPESTARGDVADLLGTSPGLFDTLRIRILEGRAFTRQDLKPSAAPVIINEAVAGHLWPGEKAVGRQLVIPHVAHDATLTVVGVAAGTHLLGVLSTEPMQVYLPYTLSHGGIRFQFLIRTTPEHPPIAAAIRAAVYSIDPNQPVASITTMEDKISREILPQRFYLVLFAAFTITAVILAAAGLNGLLRYILAARTHEIGVRIALGATPLQVAKLVLGYGLGTATLGIAIGIAVARAASDFLASFLANLNAHDVTTFALAPLVFLMVALASCIGPVLLANRVDPAACLRQE